MRLLTNSRYGTRLVIDIAVNGRSGPVQMHEIAKRQGISQKYLEKLIRSLKQAGIIKSVRGPKGGHLLAVEPDKLTVGDVVRVMEGDAALVDCERDKTSCTNAPGCLARMIWKEGSRAMFAKFDAITVAELLRYADHGIKFGDYCSRTVREWESEGAMAELPPIEVPADDRQAAEDHKPRTIARHG